MANPVIHFEIHGGASNQNDFYKDVFGWEVDANNPMNYGIVKTGSAEGIGGGLTDSDQAPTVMIYIQADDLGAMLKKVEDAGGKTAMPPTDVPGGPTIAMFTDPSGNKIGLVKGM